MKIGENAVRIIVTPISRQTFTNALPSTVSVTGSIGHQRVTSRMPSSRARSVQSGRDDDRSSP